MIRHILIDFVRRHCVVLGLAAAGCLLAGGLDNDAEILFVLGCFLPAVALALFIFDNRHGCQTTWQPLPLASERLARGLWLGSMGCTLALYGFAALAMLFSLALRVRPPREVSIYLPASLWMLAAAHGWFHLLWGLWPPYMVNNSILREMNLRQKLLYSVISVSYIMTFLAPAWVDWPKRLAKLDLPWFVPMLAGIGLLLLGRALFVRRVAGRMTFWESTPRTTTPDKQPRSARTSLRPTGFFLMAKTIILGSCWPCALALWQYVFLAQTLGGRNSMSSFAGFQLYITLACLLSQFTIMISAVNLRLLPLPPWRQTLWLIALTAIGFILPALTMGLLDRAGYAAGLFSVFLHWFPLMFGSLLLGVAIALRLGHVVVVLLLTTAGSLLLTLHFLTGTTLSDMNSHGILVSGLLLCLLAVPLLAWMLGHGDIPHREALPTSAASPIG